MAEFTVETLMEKNKQLAYENEVLRKELEKTKKDRDGLAAQLEEQKDNLQFLESELSKFRSNYCHWMEMEAEMRGKCNPCVSDVAEGEILECHMLDLDALGLSGVKEITLKF